MAAAPSPLEAGTEAPGFTGTTFDGTTVDLADYRGRGNDSHSRFATKHDLPFPLLADPDRTIIEAYGVWGEKKNYGKTYLGLQRTTFLIDEAGVIQHVFKRPRVKEHAEEIISKL
jgi:peroxiredoxin